MGGRKILSLFILMLAVFLVSGCESSKTPDGAYKKIVKASKKGDWEYVYDNVTNSSRNFLESRMRMTINIKAPANADNTEWKEMAGLSGKALFVRLAESDEDFVVSFRKEKFELLDMKSTEKRADLRVKHEGRPPEIVSMAFEDGIWKMPLSGKHFLRRPVRNPMN